MTKIKANRHQQAVLEVEKLDKELVGKINEEINHDDRNHYHVALVRITDRPGEAKNHVSIVVQQFNEPGFAKIEKNFKFLGWNKMIVVHDPRQNPKEETPIAPVQTPAPTTNAGTGMTAEEMEAEIERRAQEKANQLIEASKNTDDSANAGTGTATDENKKNIPDPFENGDTVKAMKEFAEKHNIDLSGLKLQGEIKATLLTWYNEQIKE